MDDSTVAALRVALHGIQNDLTELKKKTRFVRCTIKSFWNDEGLKFSKYWLQEKEVGVPESCTIAQLKENAQAWNPELVAMAYAALSELQEEVQDELLAVTCPEFVTLLVFFAQIVDQQQPDQESLASMDHEQRETLAALSQGCTPLQVFTLIEDVVEGKENYQDVYERLRGDAVQVLGESNNELVNSLIAFRSNLMVQFVSSVILIYQTSVDGT